MVSVAKEARGQVLLAAVLRQPAAHGRGLPFAQMCAAIDVQHLPGYVRGFNEEDDRVDDLLNLGNAGHGGQRLQEFLCVVLVQWCVDHAGSDRLTRISSRAYSIARLREIASMPPLVIIATEAVTPAMG